MKGQSQEGGDGSLNFQAGRDVSLVIHEGVTPAQATEIALAVGRSNLMEFKDYAEELVSHRVEELVGMYVSRVLEHPKAQLDAVKDPDVQYSLLTAEKEYARSGDRDRAALLVGLLVDRSASENRGLQALVLNEAIATVARLTDRQINSLTACWLIKRVQYTHATDAVKYFEWIRYQIGPFLDISDHQAEYDHLAYLGCATIEASGRGIGAILGMVYPGAFAHGFEPDSVPSQLKPYPQAFKPCPNAPGRVQVAANDDDEVTELARSLSLDDVETSSLRSLLQQNVLAEHEIEQRLLEAFPEAEELVKRWNSSLMMRVSLTSVGVAIAHTNWARQRPGASGLSKWIPDGI